MICCPFTRHLGQMTMHRCRHWAPILLSATSDRTPTLQVEDGLLHFTWRHRTATGPSGEPEVDVMFVPGAEQVTFRAVSGELLCSPV